MQVLKRFAGDRSGNVALIFGMASVVACAAVGGAIDFKRAHLAKSELQGAADAAALAGTPLPPAFASAVGTSFAWLSK